MERHNKLLGFRLFGHLARTSDSQELIVDTGYAYEIQFIPGEIPMGTLSQVNRYDEKKVDVELPEELRQSSFEKICTFLLEKNPRLAVKEQGYEKLQNRKLVLELDNSLKEPIVNVIIFVKGKIHSKNYEIELNPYDIGLSLGEIQNQKFPVIWEELQNSKKEEIHKIFPKLKPNNFQVCLNGDRIILELSQPLKQFIDSIGKPTKYQNIKHDPVVKEPVVTVLLPKEPDIFAAPAPQAPPRKEEKNEKVEKIVEKQVQPEIVASPVLAPVPSDPLLLPPPPPPEKKAKGFFAKLFSFFKR